MSFNTHIALPSSPSSFHSPRRILRLLPSSRREIRSYTAVINARIAAVRAEYAANPRFGSELPEAFGIAGSRLPRARPSSTGSQVKHSFTFDFGGYAVPAATLKSLRKSFPDPSEVSTAY